MDENMEGIMEFLNSFKAMKNKTVISAETHNLRIGVSHLLLKFSESCAILINGGGDRQFKSFEVVNIESLHMNDKLKIGAISKKEHKDFLTHLENKRQKERADEDLEQLKYLKEKYPNN